MISVRYFDWVLYEKFSSEQNKYPKYTREEIEEAILEDGARIKQLGNKRFLVLGKTAHRKHLFAVVRYDKKYTLSPIFVREMLEEEIEHYNQFQFLMSGPKN
ncbi:MAG: hypothetical protein CMK38_06980 [Porticoccaceae bacterium]|nr:hypothetical protein [Porticoccaceae bacterium]